MHLPEQIEGERLIIWVARPGDGLLFNEASIESLDQLSPWLARVSPPLTVEESEESCHGVFGQELEIRKAILRLLLVP